MSSLRSASLDSDPPSPAPTLDTVLAKLGEPGKYQVTSVRYYSYCNVLAGGADAAPGLKLHPGGGEPPPHGLLYRKGSLPLQGKNLKECELLYLTCVV